jgi:hypothetical protein
LLQLSWRETPNVCLLSRKYPAGLARAGGALLWCQSPLAGTSTPAVAPGVRALPWQHFLETL